MNTRIPPASRFEDLALSIVCGAIGAMMFAAFCGLAGESRGNALITVAAMTIVGAGIALQSGALVGALLGGVIAIFGSVIGSSPLTLLTSAGVGALLAGLAHVHRHRQQNTSELNSQWIPTPSPDAVTTPLAAEDPRAVDQARQYLFSRATASSCWYSDPTVVGQRPTSRCHR